MSQANDASALYPVFFKKWQAAGMAKLLGPRPTSDQLAKVHALGPRPGKQAFIIAMALRDCGVTPAQMVLITGTKHLNKMSDLTTDSYLREVLMPQVDGQKCYKREITPKGAQYIERNLKREAAKVAAGAAEPDKANGTAKVKKRTSAAPRKPKATADKLPPVSPIESDSPAVMIDHPNDDSTSHVTDLPENQL